MTDQNRPDPDALLKAIQKEEARSQRAKLKIFFGMAAGVGKTYSMLEAAQGLHAEGVDVVIGYVETHKRAETEAMVKELPSIPRQKIEYRGTQLEEMDIDAILARKPQLVLVDELAHTNVPGSRHPKRYQDVLELLDAGIDVFTTLNVQHIESRTDAVQQITGVVIRETVPDSIIDMADAIELIDLAPEELIKRLGEGKVYTPDRAELAVQKFFRKGNLTALREMSLRLTAERVDHQLQDYMQTKRIAGPWKSGERLMVAVSPSPLSERLVRWTRRMAYNLEAPWLAVYIEPTRALSQPEQAQLTSNLSLARKLGGEVVTTIGTDLVQSLMHIAHQRNVTQIVIGKPARNSWQELMSRGSVVNRLVRESGDIDVYVVTGDHSESTERPSVPTPKMYSGVNQYAVATLVVFLAIGINFVVEPLIGYRAVALTMLLTVLLLSVVVGRGPVFTAAALSAILWDFLFIPPRFTVFIGDFENVLLFTMYFVIAIVTGNMTARLRAHERAVRRREARTAALYALTREIASAQTVNDMLQVAVSQIGAVFDARVAILLVESDGLLKKSPQPASTFALDDKERAVAIWAFDNRKPAGRFTDTLPSSQGRYFPMLTPGGIVGVMGVVMESDERLAPDQEALLETFVNQVALAVEREMLDDAADRAKVLEESERLYAALLNSISHELRTPLAAIAGASSSLLDPQIGSNSDARVALSEDIQEATTRLNRLVENLLDMSRLESGHIKLNLEWCDINDLINVSLSHLEKQLAGRPIKIQVDPKTPLIRVDFVLIQQVLVNLLHNAATYTPPNTGIDLSVQLETTTVVMNVADHGSGLKQEDLDRVFDKFYRGVGVGAGGTGLGLSICKGLVEAHGGTITVQNRPDGGALFSIHLPALPPPPAPKESEMDADA